MDHESKQPEPGTDDQDLFQYEKALARLRLHRRLSLLVPFGFLLLIGAVDRLNVFAYLTDNGAASSPWVCFSLLLVLAAF